MKEIIAGIKAFRNDHYLAQQQFYQDLAKGQTPHCVLVTCSDSRIVVSQMTQMGPGKIFTIRNAGNIVPPYDAKAPATGEWATIEYALHVLKLKDIIVCGHRHCGAMQGLVTQAKAPELPSLGQWLSYSGETMKNVQAHYGKLKDVQEKTTAAACENVLQQLENLKTHPAVKKGLDAGTLNLHAWLYEFDNGTVSAFEEEVGQFVPLNHSETTLPHRKVTKRKP
jgi:carbonic anhydrase